MSNAQQAVVQTPQVPVAIPQTNVDSAPMQNAPETPLPAVDEGHIIKSPMVGIFYSSASPDVPAFVEIGQIVEKGEVLCIIEAMKIMNTIDAEVSGVVKEICVQDAQPVEFGQVLFKVDTNG